MSNGRTLYIVVCAAHPATDVVELVDLAQRDGWQTQIVATPSALAFMDVPLLEERTGRALQSTYRKPTDPRPPRPAAIIAAPTSFNSLCKFASGIADTYALGLLAEAIGLRIPMVIAPFVNSALANRVPFLRSVEALRNEGVKILDTPCPSALADGPIPDFPWEWIFKQFTDLYLPPREES